MCKAAYELLQPKTVLDAMADWEAERTDRNIKVYMALTQLLFIKHSMRSCFSWCTCNSCLQAAVQLS